MFTITEDAIDTRALQLELEHPSVGAVVSFEGRVRDHNAGQAVQALEYELFPELCLSEGELILQEALAKFPIRAARARHRYGLLNLEDIAVSIVVSAGHRGAAFAACQYIIDEIKVRLPIWKREHYQDGEQRWIDCPGCREAQHRVGP